MKEGAGRALGDLCKCQETPQKKGVCVLLHFLYWDSVVQRYEKKYQCEFLHFPLALHPAVGTVQADHLLISCLGDYYQRTEKMVCMENKPGRD